MTYTFLRTTIFYIMSLLLCAELYAAVNIVECEDKNGERSFQKTCPPGLTKVGDKKINTGKSLKSKTKNIKAIIYSIPDCESCIEIRELLNVKNVSIEEKNIDKNLELQKELTDLSGSLKVPTTIIGNTILTGYNRSDFINALKKAGYTEDP